MSFNGGVPPGFRPQRRGVPPPATGGSAPSDGELRSIDQGGLRPVKKL